MRTCALLPVLIALTVACAGCQTLAPTYTLSPIVKNGAERYGDDMAEFTNQALLENILRAKDFVPLNFNDLSAISGAYSLSATTGFNLPFGPDERHGSNGAGAAGFKYTATPSITGSASPVLTLGTLNTQGFMLSMLQPVSTTYILSKWDSHSHELLLRLFVKSIRFGDAVEPFVNNVDDKSCPSALKSIYKNNPDDACESAEFDLLLSKLVSIHTDVKSGGANVDMKSLLVLDPIGRPVPAGRTVTNTVPGKQDPNINQYAVAYDNTIFSTINGLSDGPLHAGNVDCPDDLKKAEDSRKSLGDPAKNAEDTYICEDLKASTPEDPQPLPFVQFYRQYPAQVALCLDQELSNLPGDSKGRFYGHKVYDVEQVSDALKVKEEKYKKARRPYDMETERIKGIQANTASGLASSQMFSAQTSGGGNPGSGAASPGGGNAAAAASSAATGASGQVTMALTPNRISAIVPGEDCIGDQIVLPPKSEDDFKVTSGGFIHVEWRSVIEVIQYLGAIARQEGTDHQVTPGPAAKLTDNTFVFLYTKNSDGPVTALYRSADYSVPDYSFVLAQFAAGANGATTTPARLTNHGLEALSMLNELVSVSKVSGSLPVSQPIQVLPP